jgi:hypothetical protein
MSWLAELLVSGLREMIPEYIQARRSEKRAECTNRKFQIVSVEFTETENVLGVVVHRGDAVGQLVAQGDPIVVEAGAVKEKVLVVVTVGHVTSGALAVAWNVLPLEYRWSDFGSAS